MFFAAIALPSLLVTLILFLAGNDDLFYQHLPPSLLVMAAWFVASFLLSLRLYTHQKVGSSRAIPCLATGSATALPSPEPSGFGGKVPLCGPCCIRTAT